MANNLLRGGSPQETLIQSFPPREAAGPDRENEEEPEVTATF